jgi:hypothetical protein
VDRTHTTQEENAMGIRQQFPNLDADVALLRAGDNDLSQIVAGTVHSDDVTGNIVYRVARPGEITYAAALAQLATELALPYADHPAYREERRP